MTETNDNLAREQMIDISPDQQAQFTVIGSGVIGLLTAHALAKQGHNVTVLSSEGKPTLNTDSTSAVAIGQFLPWVPEAHADSLLGDLSIGEVTEVSRGFYAELAQNPHETGVMPVRNIELVSSSSPWPAGLPEAMGASAEKLAEPINFPDPTGAEVPFDGTLTFDTFSINARKTVSYLAERAAQSGVKFEQRTLSAEELEGLEGIIINATGMGAGKFDRLQIVNQFKGHTFVVKPKEGHKLPREGFSIEDLIMLPREDGTAVCGALYIENPDRPIPEEKEAEELFDRLGQIFHKAAGLVDGLEPDFLDNVDILVHQAGYRVEVEGVGIRVAPDEANERLLHAYGFGGLGWSVGPHFAQKIATMAKGMHDKHTINQGEIPDEQ